jgi:hypothetical protein
MGISRKDEITVEVRATTNGCFVPFTPVPDSWAGRSVRLVVVPVEAGEFQLRGFPLSDTDGS